jgi:hypothetical protein
VRRKTFKRPLHLPTCSSNMFAVAFTRVNMFDELFDIAFTRAYPTANMFVEQCHVRRTCSTNMFARVKAAL